MNIDSICTNYQAPDGFRALLGLLNQDVALTDPRWTAYMLATVRWECANKWEPIAEFGRGAGRPYGMMITTIANGREYRNAYYGRGYVQLTWQSNYRLMGRVLGRGDDFLLNPDLLLQRENAYPVMSYGMRNGSFTGRGLSHYINDQACDYFNARRIINGLDQAERIAEYAQQFEALLKENQ